MRPAFECRCRGAGRHVDHKSSLLRHHSRNNSAQHIESAFDVYIHDLSPCQRIGIFDLRDWVDQARVIDEDIDRTKVLDGELISGAGLTPIRNVAGQTNGVGADIICNSLDQFGASRSQYDVRVKRSKVSRGGLCLLYTSPSPRDRTRSRMPSSA